MDMRPSVRCLNICDINLNLHDVRLDPACKIVPTVLSRDQSERQPLCLYVTALSVCLNDAENLKKQIAAQTRRICVAVS